MTKALAILRRLGFFVEAYGENGKTGWLSYLADKLLHDTVDRAAWRQHEGIKHWRSSAGNGSWTFATRARRAAAKLQALVDERFKAGTPVDPAAVELVMAVTRKEWAKFLHYWSQGGEALIELLDQVENRDWRWVTSAPTPPETLAAIKADLQADAEQLVQKHHTEPDTAQSCPGLPIKFYSQILAPFGDDRAWLDPYCWQDDGDVVRFERLVAALRYLDEEAACNDWIRDKQIYDDKGKLMSIEQLLGISPPPEDDEGSPVE
ncbi:hypothetical protein GCM10007350_00100 [Jeongeupia chitinilytica]|uniref:Uncharacterized protein n=1 Tax=Jeongeupia chitinilytica TaxID=1041641 RepID=A0ABQ3GU24_9NEIS|nr:hypothetical protein GCM10007350_00100 [Jeongeupia chitinilytica]